MGASTTPPVTVPEVIQMSKAGVPAETLIEKMRESGTAYRLTASQLVYLHQEGVSDAVLDYMQQTYLNAVRRDQALEDWNRWVWADDGFWYGGWPYGWPWGWSAVEEEEEEHKARALAHERQERGKQQLPHERTIAGRTGKR